MAKARGVYKGRTRRLSDEQVLYVRRAAAAGEAKSKLATDLGVSRRLVYDVLSGSGAYARPPVQPRLPLPAGEEVLLPLTLEASPPAATAEVADDEPSRHAVESSARESQRAPRGGE